MTVIEKIAEHVDRTGTSLLQFSTLLDPDSVLEMDEAIKKGCEQIDASTW